MTTSLTALSNTPPVVAVGGSPSGSASVSVSVSAPTVSPVVTGVPKQLPGPVSFAVTKAI